MEARTRRLVSLPLEPRQEAEILRLLDDAGIAHQETRSMSRFFGSDAIWVAEADYPRAQALVEKEVAEYAAAARAEWNADGAREHRGSYAQWLWKRLRNADPDAILRAILLILLVCVLLLYPLALML